MSASQVLSSFCDVQTGLLFLVAFLIAAYCLRSYRERGLPPGPWPWPIVGNMPLLAGKKNVYLIFYEMAKKFGNIFNIKIGSYNMVVVLGHKLIHEGLVTKGDHIIFRPDNLYAVKKIFQGKGIFFTSGKKWSDLRKLALVTMRDFGVGKKSLEVKINDEALMLQEKFLNYKSQPFDPLTDLNSVVANIISIIMFDSRFEFDDPEFFDLQTRVLRFFNAAGLTVPENFFPFLRVLNFFRKSKFDRALEDHNVLKDYVRKRIEEHRTTFDPKNIRDFIDLYIQATLDERDLSYTEDDIFQVIVDFFVAGSEATYVSLMWVLLRFIHHPEVQKKCREEILQVVGLGRMATMVDKRDMPYLAATLGEVQRLHNIAPLTPPHMVNKEVTLGGYTLPVHTLVTYHLYSSHMDPQCWENPTEFRPERFIGPDGKFFKPKGFVPFSSGPRACVGEHIAQMELFLFVSSLLQRFHFRAADPDHLPTLEGIQSGVFVRSYPYQLIADPL